MNSLQQACCFVTLWDTLHAASASSWTTWSPTAARSDVATLRTTKRSLVLNGPPKNGLKELWILIRQCRQFAAIAQEPIPGGETLGILLDAIEATGVFSDGCNEWCKCPFVEQTQDLHDCPLLEDTWALCAKCLAWEQGEPSPLTKQSCIGLRLQTLCNLRRSIDCMEAPFQRNCSRASKQFILLNSSFENTWALHAKQARRAIPPHKAVLHRFEAADASQLETID
jgi:hypothetical protein